MSGSQNRSILIAEDNPAMGMVLQFNLEQAGFEVTLARDGSQAAEEIGRRSFDLIITDYQMPGMSGAELCRHVRQELGVNTPIALCSAKGMEVQTAHLLVEFHLERVFIKPFSPCEVVEFARATMRTLDGHGALIESPAI